MRRVMFVLGFAAACVAPSVAAAQEHATSDPWEGFNRDMFAVHEGLDHAVLEPVARGYRAVTPEPVRQGVVNVLRNLRAPVTFANNLLQGDVEHAGVTALRFGVNSTVGIAGLFDAATSMGLERREEDFGQTLGVWGVGAGPYLFIPVLGPTNVRDGAGRVVDIAFDPFTWAKFDEEDTARAARGVMTGVSAREAAIETIDNIRRDSFDPYVTIRTSYGLLRDSAIRNGVTDVQDLPDFEDINAEPPSAPKGQDAPQGDAQEKHQAGEKQ